ncbi:hypothetical protein niasHS_014584 [Heterodera schachtii]|uniref:Uncharacterized protein n=2 Tax=Heterodera TaxID=34509 RepID=A0ABD2IF15_HETSC
MQKLCNLLNNEIAHLDELFDEVSAVNQTLAGIPEEFWLKSAEDKWKGIFEADAAIEGYKNLFRHPMHSWNEFFHWQAVN